MPTSFDAMHNETRPLALLDTAPAAAPAQQSPRGYPRTVVWLRIAKASLVLGGGLVLLGVA